MKQLGVALKCRFWFLRPEVEPEMLPYLQAPDDKMLLNQWPLCLHGIQNFITLHSFTPSSQRLGEAKARKQSRADFFSPITVFIYMQCLEHKSEAFWVSISSCLMKVTILLVFFLTKGIVRPGNWGSVRRRMRSRRTEDQRKGGSVLRPWFIHPHIIEVGGSRGRASGQRMKCLEWSLWKSNCY